MDDDIFEIEVTDLRAARAPASVPMLLGSAPERDDPPMGVPANAPANGQTVMRPLRGPSPLAARRGTRGRLLAGVGAVAALAAALVVVLASAAGPRAALGLLFATPTATVPGADTFRVANDAPWGALVVDGNRIRVGGSGFQPFFFRLAGGTHELVYTAPPFPVLRCQVSVPAVPSDTCPVQTNAPGFFHPGQTLTPAGVRVLDLRATVDNLPAGAKVMLQAAAGALLNDTRWLTTVQSGEHYLDADGRVQVARESLAATLALGLSINLNSVANINGTSCVIICSFSEPGGSFGGWPLLAGVSASWQISAPDGTLVATTPTSAPGIQPPPVTPLPLTATWNNGWQVAFATESGGPFGPGAVPGKPDTTAAAQVLCNTAQIATAGVNTPSTNYGVYGWTGLAAHPADGCVVVNQTSNVTQQLTGKPELLLYRFGVLLAASDLAHQLNPSLPVADAYERAVAKEAAIAALPPQFATTG